MNNSRRSFIKNSSATLAGLGLMEFFPADMYANMRNKVGANDKINIGLYPNPAKGFITISVNKITANSLLVISDMTGKIIQKMQVKDAMTNFSTNHLPNGMYTIQLFENDTFIQSKPFIISKN